MRTVRRIHNNLTQRYAVIQCRTYHSSQAVREPRIRTAATQRVQELSGSPGGVSVEEFREVGFVPERPLLMAGAFGPGTPQRFEALDKWFHPEPNTFMSPAPYLKQFSNAIVPFELINSYGSEEDGKKHRRDFHPWFHTIGASSDGSASLADLVSSSAHMKSESKNEVFFRFEAPLKLFLDAAAYNSQLESTDTRIKQLYIAQASIPDLPAQMRDDVATPELVRHAGRGDVYDSSIWIGLEPTYTPLHRDPSPNLFCQMASSKVVRLLPPSVGHQLYRQIQAEIQQTGHSRMRGSEMMVGDEKKALHDAIWAINPKADVFEATLHSGDALFIPKGWWHSVRSKFDDGSLNASVNWWFR